MDTPYSIAWQKFITSAEGKRAMDSSILREGEHWKTYLENRLRTAFDAGWNYDQSSKTDESAA